MQGMDTIIAILETMAVAIPAMMAGGAVGYWIREINEGAKAVKAYRARLAREAEEARADRIASEIVKQYRASPLANMSAEERAAFEEETRKLREYRIVLEALVTAGAHEAAKAWMAHKDYMLRGGCEITKDIEARKAKEK